MPIQVGFVTCARLPDLFQEEGELLVRARARGWRAEAVVWSDGAVDFASFDLLVIRSPWDYFQRETEFRAWLDAMEAADVALQNPAPLVRWNLDKRYLGELERRGARIVPTRFVTPEAPVDLAALAEEEGWPELVLKPAVSGAAFRTCRFARAEAPVHQAQLAEILAGGAALVQPFAREIVDEGEWSLFFFGGAFSHAIVKQPAHSDYRVQPQHGGTFRRVAPEPALIDEARAVIALLPAAPLYVRVDGIRRGGHLYLMEVEAIEPYLFFAAAPEAMDLYLDAIGAAAHP